MKNIINLPPEINKYLSDPNKAAILLFLLSRTGQVVTIDAVRPLKFLKEFKHFSGQKYSTFQARAGINYENLGSTVEKRQQGSPPIGLRGKEWLKFPYITRSLANNNLYFRFYALNNKFTPTNKYIINGQEVPKSELAKYCLASEYKDKDGPICFDFPIQGIEKIH